MSQPQSLLYLSIIFFFFNDTATTEIYTLSLHDALPICGVYGARGAHAWHALVLHRTAYVGVAQRAGGGAPLAPGVEQSPAQAIAAFRGDAACAHQTGRGGACRLARGTALQDGQG